MTDDPEADGYELVRVEDPKSGRHCLLYACGHREAVVSYRIRQHRVGPHYVMHRCDEHRIAKWDAAASTQERS